MPRPDYNSFPQYYHRYVDQVDTEDLISGLMENKSILVSFLKSIPSDRWEYRYAPDKWTIKEVCMHVIDTERVFAYRALAISRGGKTHLPSFDENAYVANTDFSHRSFKSIIGEYKDVRNASIALFEGMREDDLKRSGVASDNDFTVHSIGFIIKGHCTHHMNVIKERYLS